MIKLKKNKRRLSEFGEPIFLITIAIVFFWLTRSPAYKSPEDTQKITSTLSSKPESKRYGEDNKLVEFQLTGHEVFFQFQSCGFSREIEHKMNQLQIGDVITIYTNPINPKNPKNKHYPVYAASSKKHGPLLQFSAYNSCERTYSYYVHPIIYGFVFLTGMYSLLSRLMSKKIKFNTKYLHPNELQETHLILRPNWHSFIFQNSGNTFICLIIGTCILLFLPQIKPVYGLGVIAIGIYFFLHSLSTHAKTYYLLDSEGIHIKKIPPMLKAEITTIRYEQIKKVKQHRGFGEDDTTYSSIHIDSGQTDSEGDKVYDKLIGIEKAEEVVELIHKNIKSSKTNNNSTTLPNA